MATLKKTIVLKDGLLELTRLKGGKIVLGEILKGITTLKELRSVLYREKYGYGILEHNLRILAQQYQGQIPVAVAGEETEAIKVYIPFDQSDFSQLISAGIDGEDWEAPDLLFPVKSGDKLLTVLRPPRKRLRLPDGSIQIPETNREMPVESIGILCGPNTDLEADSKTIIAAANGCAHFSPFGRVAVYPLRSYRSLSRLHNRVEMEAAIRIEKDVQPKTFIRIPSNLSVGGFIKSAFVKVDGNIQCGEGIFNNTEWKRSALHAGQHIYTAVISGYRVWSGGNVVVRKMIDHCKVQCLNNVVSPFIANSEIRVGNRLYSGDIMNGTTVYLGRAFINRKSIEIFKDYQIRYRKRLRDLESELTIERISMELLRKKIGIVAKKLKRLSGNDSKFHNMLSLMLERFYGCVLANMERFEDRVKNYKYVLDALEQKQMELAFFEAPINHDAAAEIVVTGKIDTGVTLIAPNQVLQVKEPLQKVIIRLNKQCGTFEIKPFSVPQPV